MLLCIVHRRITTYDSHETYVRKTIKILLRSQKKKIG